MKTMKTLATAAVSAIAQRRVKNPAADNLLPHLGQRQRSEMAAFLSRTGNVADFLTAYGPGAWTEIASCPDAALTADEPTMRRIDAIFGRGTTVRLVQASLAALFFTSSRIDESSNPAIADYAPTLAVELAGLRPSELCLFFHRFKAGQIGRGYASFELRHVGMALQDFIRWRMTALAGAEARTSCCRKNVETNEETLIDPQERFKWPRYVVRMLTPNAASRQRMAWRFGLATLAPDDSERQWLPTTPLLISGYLSPKSRTLLEECERRRLVEIVCVRIKSPGFGFGNEAVLG